MTPFRPFFSCDIIELRDMTGGVTFGRGFTAITEHIQTAPLLRPDEITIQFSRESGAGLLLIKERQPIWYLRMDYHSLPWFAGRYVSPQPQKPVSFGMRTPDALTAIAQEFAELRQRMGTA